MKKMKKQLAVAVTVALLTLPLSASMALAETGNPSTTIVTTTEEISDDTILDTTVTDETVVDEIVTAETTTEETITDETTAVTDEDGKAVAPSNWLSVLIGKLQLALIADPVRKGQLNERHALAKLAEAQKLMTEGKAEASEKALNKYTEKIALAQEFLGKVGDSESEEAQKLTIALTSVNTNNIKVLGNLLVKLPPQAAQRVALNVVRSMERAVNKAEKQEAKDATVIPSETSLEATETVPVTVAPAMEAKNKSLEKQAKVALRDFRKTLQEKHIVEPEDEKQPDEENGVAQDSDSIQSTEVLSVSNSRQAASVNVAPAQPQKVPASVQALVQEKREQVKLGSQGKDKSLEKSDNRANKSDQRD